MITTTATADTITYTMIIDGEQVSHLDITADHRIVANVETLPAHRGRGYASQLWVAANADGECYHAIEHHRTAEGDAFAQAVGGETADDADDYCEHCCICTGDAE